MFGIIGNVSSTMIKCPQISKATTTLTTVECRKVTLEDTSPEASGNFLLKCNRSWGSFARNM